MSRGGVAQRTAQTLKDGCSQQEALSTLWLAAENFFNQVIYDVAVIAGEGRNEAGSILPPLHGKRRQLQPRDPTFGAGHKRCYVFSREVQAHRVSEKCCRLLGRKAQV